MSFIFVTTENWNIPQDIMVSVIDDKLAENEHQHEPIQHQVTNTDINYNNLAINAITVHVIDNDTSSISLSTNILNLNEGNNTNFNIVLNTIPTQPVIVNLLLEDGITISPATLTFDADGDINEDKKEG